MRRVVSSFRRAFIGSEACGGVLPEEALCSSSLAASRMMPTSCSYSTEQAASAAGKQSLDMEKKPPVTATKPKRLPGPFGRPIPIELSDAFGPQDRRSRRKNPIPQIAADNAVNAPLRFQSGSQSVRMGQEGSLKAQEAEVARVGSRITKPMSDREGWVNGAQGSSVLSLKSIVLSKVIDRTKDPESLAYLHERVAKMDPKTREARINKHNQILSVLDRAAALHYSLGKGGPLAVVVESALRYCKENLEDFDVHGLKRMLEAWSKVGVPMDLALWPRIQDRLLLGIDQVKDARDIRRLTWSLVRFKPAVTFRRDLRQALEKRIIELAPTSKCSKLHTLSTTPDSQGASGMLAALGSLYWNVPPEVIRALVAEVTRHSEHMHGDEFAKALLGASKLVAKFPELASDAKTRTALQKLCRATEPRLEALLEDRKRRRSQRKEAEAMKKKVAEEEELETVAAPVLKVIDVAHVLTAFRSLGYEMEGPGLMQQMADLVTENDKGVTPKDLATVMGALLALRFTPAPEQARAWGLLLGRRLLSFDEGDLRSLEDPLDALESRSYPTYRSLASGAAQSLQRTNQRLGAVSGDRASRTLKALAKMRLYPGSEVTDTFLEAIVRDAQEGQLNPDRAVDALWSLANLRHRPSPQIASSLLGLTGGLSLQQTSDALWSLASLAVVPLPAAFGPLLMQARSKLGQETSTKDARIHAKTLSRLAHSLAYFVAVDDQSANLRAALLKLLPAEDSPTATTQDSSASSDRSDPSGMTEQGHWNAGAAATLEVLRRLASLFEQALASPDEAVRDPSEGLAQLYQSIWILEGGLGRGTAGAVLSMNPSLRAAALEAAKGANTGVVVSAFQRDVEGTLRALGCAVETEHLLSDGVHSVDMVLTNLREQRVAVSVEGPLHFSRNDLCLLGLRGRVERVGVRAEGFTLIEVPFFEWAALGGHVDRKKEYLREALGEHLGVDIESVLESPAESPSPSKR